MSFLVLVVDDEPDIEMLFRQQFRRDLRDNRFKMDFARSAASALQRIGDAGGESLILILSDINMPGMSGLELLPKAKALRPNVPVIMITAYGAVAQVLRCSGQGRLVCRVDPIRNQVEKHPGDFLREQIDLTSRGIE